MHLACLQRRTYDTIKTCLFGALSIVHNHLVDGLFNEQIILHTLLVGRGELGYSNQQRTGAVLTGQALQSGAHHILGTGSMEIGDVHIQIPQNCHCLFHSVGNIVQLQIQENLMSSCFDFLHDSRTLRIVQLHTDFHKGLPTGELVQKREGLLRAGKITGYNYVLTHYFAPPIISLKVLILYLSIASGSCSTISRQI